jgi:hypothetical protein
MDVFSTGMNDLEVKMSRRGIRASVHNHSEFMNLAEAIGERHRRGIRENVVIIGHSLGANDAFRMAERLDDFGVKVPLIITYDPTATMSAGRNVSRVVNFYSSTNGWGVAIARGPGFRGSLSNIDLSRRGEMGHTDIDKSPALHSQSIGYVQSIGGSRSSTATVSPKKDSSDKESSTKSESKSADTKDAKPETADKETADKKETAATTESADKKDTAATAEKSETAEKKDPADKKETAAADDKKATEQTVAAKPAAEPKPAAKDAAPESVASVPAKPAEKDASASKPAAKESAAAAKPDAKDATAAAKPAEKDAVGAKPAKTETAASKDHAPATSN